MTASMAKPICLTSFISGDSCEYRTGFQGTWRAGFVVGTEGHCLIVEDAVTRRRYTIQLGKQGRVRALRSLHGKKMEQDLACAKEQARRLPPIAPVVVRTGAASRAAPGRRRRYRSAKYLCFVRSWPCCSCQRPAPSDPHHVGERGVGQKADDFGCVPLCRSCHEVVQVTYAAPGRTRDETERLLQAEQVRLLIEWAGHEDLAG